MPRIYGQDCDIHFSPDDEPVDWRAELEDADDDPLFDEDGPTPPEVVAILGFDPDDEE